MPARGLPPQHRLRGLRDQLSGGGGTSASARGNGPAASEPKATTVDPTTNRAVPDPLEPALLVRDDESYVDASPLLSAAEIAAFKRDGFILKRWAGRQYAGETPNPLVRAQEYMWSIFPEGISRDDPTTWVDPNKLATWQAECRPRGDDTDYLTATSGGTGWKWHQAGVDKWCRDMLHANDWVCGVVKQMVGGPLREAERARGIYNLFPTSDPDKGKRLGPHHDTCNSQVIVMMLIDDVAVRSGGFTVWPGSHVPLYHTHTDEWHWSPTEGNEAAIAEVVGNIRPAEITGKAGDVCFMHGRTMHSQGLFLTQDSVRMAMFADFQQEREIYPEFTKHPSSKNLQWWHDSREYVVPCPVHPEDMWSSWEI